ncbi:MAG: Type II secretion system protein E [Spirochaetes bacterium ADurb.BinA120]|nr:MAG: Type II secretion system protein E [Spirochaetes bacterium ADurb.BinA120]
MSEFLRKKKIGQILIEMGVIDDQKLEWALQKQQETNQLLGQTLLGAGYITEDDLGIALAKQFDVPYIDLKDVTVSDEAKRSVPANLLQTGEFVPLEIVDKTLTIAISDPTNYELIDRLSTVTGYEIKYVLSTQSQIRAFLGLAPAGGPSQAGEGGGGEGGEGGEGAPQNDDPVSDVNLEFESDSEDDGGKADILKQQADQKPIILLVNKIILNAVNLRVSDIHIESWETKVLVRYRLDGILTEQMTIAKKAGPAIISRIKIMSDLNIAERSVPQDGAFSIKLGKKTVDFRVSIIPCAEGECACLRILAKENLKLDLKALGFSDIEYDRFNRAIRRPYGIILVSGPTGSGKTTTLYAALQSLNDSETKIITAEDPVEYKLAGLNQINVKINKTDPDRSLTFGKALKAMLRHDPDIILLGEIREHETADIAIKAALTGHLVFSTVHANNAIDVIGRMADMDIDRYLLAAAFIEVIAQRLVKTICKNCIEEYTPTEDDFKFADLHEPEHREIKYYKGAGCKACGGKGYKGRAAVYEILDIDDEIRAMIATNTSLYDIKKVGLEKGMTTIHGSTLAKIKKGETTIQELIRVNAA